MIESNVIPNCIFVNNQLRGSYINFESINVTLVCGDDTQIKAHKMWGAVISEMMYLMNILLQWPQVREIARSHGEDSLREISSWWGVGSHHENVHHTRFHRVQISPIDGNQVISVPCFENSAKADYKKALHWVIARV
jgi:hypothetical protein